MTDKIHDLTHYIFSFFLSRKIWCEYIISKKYLKECAVESYSLGKQKGGEGTREKKGKKWTQDFELKLEKVSLQQIELFQVFSTLISKIYIWPRYLSNFLPDPLHIHGTVSECSYWAHR